MHAFTKYIAVFADPHGHLRLLFALCRGWQRAHGRHLDGILVCGDLGFYPNPDLADKPTRRFAKHDTEELGFSLWFRSPQPLMNDTVLHSTFFGDCSSLDTVLVPAYWCNGNHEDFNEIASIDGARQPVAVDAFGMLRYLPSGSLTNIAGISVGAIGGAPEIQQKDHPRTDTAFKFKYVNARRVNQLSAQRFDILVSHCAPSGLGGESDAAGSDLLRGLVECTRPAYHFFGHHSTPVEPGTIGTTRCFYLAQTGFDTRDPHHPHRLRPGRMGILGWNSSADTSFEIVDEPWMDEFTAEKW